MQSALQATDVSNATERGPPNTHRPVAAPASTRA